MMYGVIATMSDPVAYVPVDAAALAYLDFISGTYEMNGAAALLTDLLSGIDGADIDASGLAVRSGNASRPTATAGLMAILTPLLTDGFTILFEIQASATSMEMPGFSLWNDPVQGDATEALLLNIYPTASDYGSISIGGTYTRTLPGVNKVGFTVGRPLGGGSYRTAISCNGTGASNTGDVAYTQASTITPFSRADFGFAEFYPYSTDDYFRKIIIYPVMDETALAALTA